MSAEHFDTLLTADMRTAPDGIGIELAPAMSQQPRAFQMGATGLEFGDRERGFAACHVNAELAIQIAAQAVADQPMTGLTGDHPEKRKRLAAVLSHAASMVRDLALDDAYDGTLTEERWNAQLGVLETLVLGDAEHLPTTFTRHRFTVVGYQP